MTHGGRLEGRGGYSSNETLIMEQKSLLGWVEQFGFFLHFLVIYILKNLSCQSGVIPPENDSTVCIYRCYSGTLIQHEFQGIR